MKRLITKAIIALSTLTLITLGGCAAFDRFGEAIKKNPEAAGSAIRLSTLVYMRDLSIDQRRSLAESITSKHSKVSTQLEAITGSQIITVAQIDEYVAKEFSPANSDTDPVDYELILIALSFIKAELAEKTKVGEVPENTVVTIKFVIDNLAEAVKPYL